YQWRFSRRAGFNSCTDRRRSGAPTAERFPRGRSSMSESAEFPRPGASRRRFLAGTGVLGGAAALAACGGATGGGGGGGGGGGEELVGVGNGGQAGTGRAGDGADQLFIAGFQWSPPTNFNTFAGAPAWPASSNVAQYIYETLLRFHIVTG